MCHSILKYIVEHALDENFRVIINYIIKGNLKKCKSGNKSRLTGKEWNKFLNMLINCNISPTYIQRIKAKTKMNNGDKE